METAAHLNLKRLALLFLRRRGCVALATEVRCPISRYRVDAAGYGDGGGLSERDWGAGVTAQSSILRPQSPFTIVVECKQCRADFLRDCEAIAPLLELRKQYEAMRRSIQEHRVKTLEPQLRRHGTSLFADLDDWDFHASKLPGYRKVMRQLRRVDEKLHGETKFFLMAKYALADELYLAAPSGVIAAREVPPGWGLLECSQRPPTEGQDGGNEAMLDVKLAATLHCTKPAHRMRLLRNIAVAASRRVEARSRD